MSPIRIHGRGSRVVAVAGECLRVEDRLALARQGTFVALTGTRGLDTVAEAVREAFPGMIADVDFAATLRGAATWGVSDAKADRNLLCPGRGGRAADPVAERIGEPAPGRPSRHEFVTLNQCSPEEIR